MVSYRIIEQGNGFSGVETGAEVYCADSGELMVLEGVGLTIHTDDPRGNYITANARTADRDVTSLTDAEFGSLPQVLVEVDA